MCDTIRASSPLRTQIRIDKPVRLSALYASYMPASMRASRGSAFRKDGPIQTELEGSQNNEPPPLKREADRYFGENKAYAGLGRASLRGGVTLVAGRGVNVLVQLASKILLARLLSPHEFGLVAMVTALVL